MIRSSLVANNRVVFSFLSLEMAHEHEDLVVGRDDAVAGEGDRSETASQDDAALLVSS